MKVKLKTLDEIKKLSKFEYLSPGLMIIYDKEGEKYIHINHTGEFGKKVDVILLTCYLSGNTYFSKFYGFGQYYYDEWFE